MSRYISETVLDRDSFFIITVSGYGRCNYHGGHYVLPCRRRNATDEVVPGWDTTASHEPAMRPDGDAVRLFDVHRDKRLVPGGGRSGRSHGDPPVQTVRPVDVAGGPVHGDAVHRRRRSRQNDAQTERPVDRQLHQESVEQSPYSPARLRAMQPLSHIHLSVTAVCYIEWCYFKFLGEP